MSTINPANNLQFKSTDAMFARVRKRLRSYDAVGILDEGDWYYYIKEVIEKLGVAVYDECEAGIFVKDFKGPLPDNFSTLYAAYKCKSEIGTESKQTLFPQSPLVFYIEDSYQRYHQSGSYASRCVYGEKVTIRTVINAKETDVRVFDPILLRLSGNVRTFCEKDCKNLSSTCKDEIKIDGKFIFSNFNEGVILMKYYGMALEQESGLPMIPDNTFIEKAIEDYIVYRVFEDFMFNGDVPDIDKKYQLARMNYDESLKTALYWVKLPSFQAAINHIRQVRKNLRAYQL